MATLLRPCKVWSACMVWHEFLFWEPAPFSILEVKLNGNQFWGFSRAARCTFTVNGHKCTGEYSILPTVYGTGECREIVLMGQNGGTYGCKQHLQPILMLKLLQQKTTDNLHGTQLIPNTNYTTHTFVQKDITKSIIHGLFWASAWPTLMHGLF